MQTNPMPSNEADEDAIAALINLVHDEDFRSPIDDEDWPHFLCFQAL